MSNKYVQLIDSDGNNIFPRVAGAEIDYEELASGTTGQALPIVFGGTGASTPAAARTTLGAESILDSKQKRNIYVSTSEPTMADGVNGDIWFVYE